MQDCVNKMRERAQLADVDLRDASGDAALPDIRVDQAKIEQVLVNLLSNSIKFSQKGGQVIFDVECDLDDGLAFTVEDSGAGMSESQIENALKPFSRGARNITTQPSAGSLTPPVIAPPVIAPPVIAPPVIAPPVIAPPVIAPPVIAPPVIAPPVIAPPVIAPPVIARTKDEAIQTGRAVGAGSPRRPYGRGNTGLSLPVPLPRQIPGTSRFEV